MVKRYRDAFDFGQTNNSALIQLTTGSGKSEIIADPNVIYSVPDTVEAKAFDEIKNTLSANEGFAIDYENSPGDVQRFFEEHEIQNGWYGSGINAAFPDSEDHRNALKTAGLMRNLDKTIKKTYICTI
ncbi:MAG: hypothetical protein H6Q21_1600 [Bacteroidetes bacterium]|nr:hypothetical protein [Bacteroidota bacterium]